MLPITQKHFNAFIYVKKLKKAGVQSEQAEIQAEAIEEAIDDMVNRFPYATRNDLDKLQAATKHDLDKLQAATKIDSNELKADMSELRNELKADMSELRNELKTDMSELRNELKTDMIELRNEFKTDMKEFQHATARNFERVDFELKSIRKDMAVLFAKQSNKFFLWGTTMNCGLLVVMAKGFHWI